MRTATIKRDTRETQIDLTFNLDGTGKASIASRRVLVYIITPP